MLNTILSTTAGRLFNPIIPFLQVEHRGHTEWTNVNFDNISGAGHEVMHASEIRLAGLFQLIELARRV